MKKACEYSYAFSCDAGLVVEVYEIETWHAAGTTMNAEEKNYRKACGLSHGEKERIEFKGKIAPAEIRKLYINTNVKEYWGRSQTPFKYVDV